MTPEEIAAAILARRCYGPVVSDLVDDIAAAIKAAEAAGVARGQEACVAIAKGFQASYVNAASGARAIGHRRATAEYTAAATACGEIREAIRARTS